MKAFHSFFLFIFLLHFSANCQSQGSNVNGLKFSKAIFLSLKSDRLKNYIAIDTTIIVEKGKVWKITSAKSFIVKSDFNPYENDNSLNINDQVINYYKSPFECPIWLPEGKYNIQLMSKLRNDRNKYIAYLSVIEYAIEGIK